MRKMIGMLLAAAMVVAMAACGVEPLDADTMITRAPQTATDAPVETVEQTEAVEKIAEDPFVFVYEGVKLLPGAAFDASALPEADAVSQVPSCALEGTDNVYNYTTFEVTAFDDGTGEEIYSIYLLDPNLTTPEGLALGDDEANVTQLYGTDYVQEGTAYIYTRQNTILSVIVQDGTVVSIEYRLAL